MNVSSIRSGAQGVYRLFERANPLFKRELTQSSRLTRTPWILLGLTIVIAFVMCTVGGVSATSTSPGEIGEILFHTFFSIAAAVVAIAGPSLSANAIAAEREGRTWEALRLTGMPITRIARGKFLASYAGIALYIVVLAPVGAICSVFGGVTGLELSLAFAFLLAFAALSVAFGLAMSSLMHSSRGAILVTLFGAIFLAPILYFFLGVGGSVLSSHAVGGFKEGAPIWVPLAITRGEFGLTYVLLAIIAPLASLLLPAWFLYELAIANLEDVNGDRASRMKAWFLSTSVVVTGLAVTIPFAAQESARFGIGLLTQVAVALYLLAAPLLFAGEADAPSKLLEATWKRDGVSAAKRFFGPAHLRAQAMSATIGCAVWIATVTASRLATVRSSDGESLFIIGAYFAPFIMFHTALCTYLRARSGNAWVARAGTIVVGVLLTTLPWILVILSGGTRGDGENSLAFAAPSPAFAALLVEIERSAYRYPSAREQIQFSGVFASVFYLIGTVVFATLAVQQTRRAAAARRATEAQTQAALEV